MTYCSTWCFMQKNRHSSRSTKSYGQWRKTNISERHWLKGSLFPQFPFILKGKSNFRLLTESRAPSRKSPHSVHLGISSCTSCFDVQKQTLPLWTPEQCVIQTAFYNYAIYLILFLLHLIGAKFIQSHYLFKTALNGIQCSLIIKLRISTASMEYWRVKTRYGDFCHFL